MPWPQGGVDQKDHKGVLKDHRRNVQKAHVRTGARPTHFLEGAPIREAAQEQRGGELDADILREGL
jgi:hypothetical protein